MVTAHVVSRRWLLAAAFALLCFLISTSVASAHERRAVGDYQLVVGFFTEPAIVEEPNGLILRVQKGTASDAPPVEGLAETLKAEVKYGSQTMPLTLRAVFGTPGSYRSDFIPTAEGAYTFRVFGTLEGMSLDESFTSGPNTFSEVDSRADLTFPDRVESIGSVATTAQNARDTADGARMLAIAGIGIGVLGLVAGVVGVQAARRSRTAARGASVASQREASDSTARP